MSTSYEDVAVQLDDEQWKALEHAFGKKAVRSKRCVIENYATGMGNNRGEEDASSEETMTQDAFGDDSEDEGDGEESSERRNTLYTREIAIPEAYRHFLEVTLTVPTTFNSDDTKIFNSFIEKYGDKIFLKVVYAYKKDRQDFEIEFYTAGAIAEEKKFSIQAFRLAVRDGCLLKRLKESRVDFDAAALAKTGYLSLKKIKELNDNASDGEFFHGVPERNKSEEQKNLLAKKKIEFETKNSRRETMNVTTVATAGKRRKVKQIHAPLRQAIWEAYKHCLWKVFNNVFLVTDRKRPESAAYKTADGNKQMMSHFFKNLDEIMFNVKFDGTKFLMTFKTKERGEIKEYGPASDAGAFHDAMRQLSADPTVAVEDSQSTDFHLLYLKKKNSEEWRPRYDNFNEQKTLEPLGGDEERDGYVRMSVFFFAAHHFLINRTRAHITEILREQLNEVGKPKDFPDSSVDRNAQFDLVSTEVQIIDDVLNNIVNKVVDKLDSMNMVEFSKQLMAAQRGIL